MRRVIPFTLAAAAMLLGGVRPRAGVSDYPAHQSIEAASFGAGVIPASEAKKIFAADLRAAGYIVIEVGVFPTPGHDVDLSSLDFTLRTDPNSLAARTADVGAIVVAAIKEPAPTRSDEGRDVSVVTSASIEHASYPDPLTGRKTGATIVGEGVGVGVGTPGSQTPSSPRSSGPTRFQLDQELHAKALPEGMTAAPVAGYLYFPKPSRKSKNAAWVLQWETPAGRMKVTLPNPVK